MTRRTPLFGATLVASSLVVAVLASTGTVVARHGGNDPTPTPSATASGSPTATASPSHGKSDRARTTKVTVKVSSAPQGGSIKVQVRVGHPAKGSVFAARATATLATGPVTLDLRRSGTSFVAVGRIPVPGTQPAGPVAVTVLVRYGDSTTSVVRTVLIRPAGGDDASPSPSASPTASPSTTP